MMLSERRESIENSGRFFVVVCVRRVLGVIWVLAVCRRFARQSRTKTGALRLQNSAPLGLLFPEFLKL
jgi:hypothetical protein